MTFWEALDLDRATPPVVAIVGGGGKTSLLFRLAQNAHQLGYSTVLSGTTRFTTPPALSSNIHLTEITSPKQVQELVKTLNTHDTIVAHAGKEPKARWAPIETATADEIAAIPGLGLFAIEADGSKMLPFKAPAEHEPVIPCSATHVVAVVGLSALDTPLDSRYVHRPEKIRSIIENQQHASIEVIARVLTDIRGGRKGVKQRHFSVVVNQADLHPERALLLGKAIRRAGAPRVIVTALRDNNSLIKAVL